MPARLVARVARQLHKCCAKGVAQKVLHWWGGGALRPALVLQRACVCMESSVMMHSALCGFVSTAPDGPLRARCSSVARSPPHTRASGSSTSRGTPRWRRCARRSSLQSPSARATWASRDAAAARATWASRGNAAARATWASRGDAAARATWASRDDAAVSIGWLSGTALLGLGAFCHRGSSGVWVALWQDV
eukprot:285097-Chlamydomonas_euryale.AAC.5